MWYTFQLIYTSPERSFASVMIRKQSIYIECFTGYNPLEGTKVSNIRFAPRWSKLVIKNDSDFENSLTILKESHKRIKSALKSGETTGYFSGGESTTGNESDAEEHEE